ncbi:integrator complex subunit 5 [Notothenia coriiceps]|uniref:Integrator complex subunit 5 n=1 Tax=Notothenia coriiceps TaxID=8208 RepID=A0A6I9MIJ3_9TELE|nr:PREDICTED: integrator complex subunit 5 [Notothenia coriiceps]XP_010766254.1 PREDICTED: integrator complex subunit 5 [Notothenia coriiceps]
MLKDQTMSVVLDGSPLKVMQSSHTHTPQTALSAQELSQEIKSFISGFDSVQGRKLSVREHARCAVRLLRSVPACRGAVLEHLRGVYDEYVSAFLHNLETENDNSSGVSSNLEDIIQEVHGVLSEFIRLNPRAWAPLVSAWAVDLLGQLSSKHAGRRVAPHSSSLNELLQLWMSCAATRSLMEAYSQCLAAMLAWCPDACVDALLDTSVQHSPHFDWVVAHIGSAFPGTIISRVLACGLKDFCSHGAKDTGLMAMGVDKGSRVPKIGSVVGILGHLAVHHSDSIRKELLRMFQESLCPSSPLSPTSSSTSWESSPQLRRAAVPFLLQLAAMSPNLFGAVSAELVELLRPPVLLQLQAVLQGIPREELDNMLGLAVHLISQSPSGGSRVLRFLADTATPASVIISGPTPSPHEGVREGCDRLLQMLLLHLHKLVFNRSEGAEVNPHRSASTQPRRVIPFLEELQSHVGELCAETLRLERKRHLWLHQLLCLLSVYGGPSVATEALCQLLTQAHNPEELALAWQLHSTLSSCMSGLIPAAVTRCVAQIHTHTLGTRQLTQLLLNMAAAIQSQDEERRGASGVQSSMAIQVGSAVSGYLHDFGPLLLHGDPDVSHATVRLLSCSPLPRTSSPAHLLLLSRAAVTHFFVALRRRGEGGKLERDGGQACEEVNCSVLLLSRFAAYSSLTLKAVLQQLVEGALHKGNAGLFGGQIADMSGAPLPSKSVSPDIGASLLDINCRFGTTVNFSGSVWSVFHAGVIGKGLKVRTEAQLTDPSGVMQNVQTLLAVVVQCCSSSGLNGSRLPSDPDEPLPINAEAAKVIAVTMVENVCPDVANGELSWPPEEHARTTVERDIHIRRCFEAHPVLFPLLQVVAAGRPALCYCSAVLRGLLATLLAHWEASREVLSTDSPWHLQASCLLVSCMGEGQLLPPVLANVHETFPHLTPFEVRLLLVAVWEYVRGNGPMPQKFIFNSEKGLFCRDFSRDGDVARYVAPIHSVLHKNIDRLGHLCWRFQL